MSKYRIRIFSDFSTCEGNKTTYEALCMAFSNTSLHYGKDKEIYLTADDDYTHAILFNRAMPVLKPIPKSNVVGFALEPPQFLKFYHQDLEYYQKYVGKYYIGDTYGVLPSPFVSGRVYMWHTPFVNVLDLKPMSERLPMSIMVSEKTDAPGHKYRHELVQLILQTNLPIDIYGRGCAKYANTQDPRLKGTFKSDGEMFENYRYTIAIENNCVKWYFSEKLLNPLIYGTTPLYLGSEMASEVYPETFHRLTGDVNHDFKFIVDVINHPSKYQTHIDQNAVRKSMNLLENLDSVFS